jgi:hypothetical protein
VEFNYLFRLPTPNLKKFQSVLRNRAILPRFRFRVPNFLSTVPAKVRFRFRFYLVQNDTVSPAPVPQHCVSVPEPAPVIACRYLLTQLLNEKVEFS